LSNLLKGQLFLAALELQEAWIREMPYFERELEALAKLLLAPHLLSVTAAQRLWELFFMVIPVVSTTLASVERMFTGLGAEALGHVIIDEAGQATPQSAVGIILRAKRALIIGDQRQLEPICQVPQPIIARVSSILGEHAEEMTALQPTLSAQTFADSANCYGTYLGAGDGADGSFVNLEQGTWVGTPLIVHRRCNEPMFSISNQVAYGGLMIHATKDTEAQLPLGKSCWIQSAGSAEEKQWVPEHGEICIRMVLRLLAFESDNPNFFIITPFRIVKRKLQHELSACLKARGYEPRIIRAVKNVTGTIHTFQGKESDVVILVLGCDFTKGGAAHWAGDRPNLINVAVTRARKALYVVGDANLWHNRGYFSDLEKALPKRSVEEFLR
jgi:superfamily I DNA and/or RNA helicase